MESRSGREALVKRVATPLGLWLMTKDATMDGAPFDSAALRDAVVEVAQRSVRSGRREIEDAVIDGGGALRIIAEPVSAGVMVAALGLDDLSELDDQIARWELVMRATHDAIWDWNIAAQKAWWNRQHYQMLGYDPDRTAPSFEAWLEAVHPDDRERVVKHFETLIVTGESGYQDEYRLLRKDGSIAVAFDRAYIQRGADGQPVRMIGVVSDVTAERAATAALKVSEEVHRQLTTAIDQVFWLVSAGSREVIYISPHYEKLWGRTCESLRQRPDSFLDAIHPDDRPRIIERRVAQAEGELDEIYRICRPDGTVAWIRDRAFPVRDERGEVIRIAGVATDITTQRRLEEQLINAQKLDSIGRLAGGIAHDFNNLLTVILTGVDYAMRKVPAGGEARAELVHVRDAADRATQLTSQLLAFARRHVVAPTRLDLNELTRHMDQLLRRVIGEHIELNSVLRADLAAVVVDRAQLEQVLVNMAVNARDAMPNGGRLTIETRNVIVDRRYVSRHAHVEAGAYVSLTISDTGVGIAPEALPHIFEPFFTTKPLGHGTGLGLATCHGIVHQAGGRISVDTELGRGTTFQILLPQAGDDATVADHPNASSLAGGTETILFVEDDPGVRRIGVRTLTEHGYEVMEAWGSEEALRVATERAGRIDLLLTDVVMPHMSGIDLAERLIVLRPELRVLYTSGYTQSALVHRQVAFLQKPYVPETLLARVREVLDADELPTPSPRKDSPHRT
jgi:PAS domain S-box-containing protein